MIKHIDHINIVVRDLEKAKQFFLDLGFEARADREGSLEGAWIERVTKLKDAKGYYCTLSLPDAQTNIELIHYDSPEDQDDPLIDKPNHIGFRHIAFVVDDIEQFVAQLKKKNVSLFSEIQEYKPTKKKLCYFYGPEGIVLEVAEYGS
jgi:catechol 2,3-dioxygenase-like lactoylglutathione lyase family enzyme